MIVPAKHPQEAERLAALRKLQILDTLAEKEFDEITLIAAQICGVPVAMISLVDEDRQWFKSKFGVSIDETPRDIAFCAHAILQTESFVVPDATKDPRFAQNPLVLNEPAVRFYAGTPLLSPDNQPIGTLCVLDTKSRVLSSAQMASLEALGNQVNRLLVLRTHIQSLEAINARLETAKLAEERLRHLEVNLMAASKMSALGQMVSGIAHEINTPLSVIQLTAEILQDKIAAADKDAGSISKDLRTIENTVSHIAKIIVGLRTIARPSESEDFVATSLEHLVTLTSHLCEPRFKSQNIRFSVKLPPSINISCRVTQISQVLVNLLNNACDAVENLNDKWVSIHAEVGDESVTICVTDSGFGLPPEIVAKLALPFFTTKPAGKGTGLGLSISKTIAQNHGGTLTYDSSSGHTCFKLSLPL